MSSKISVLSSVRSYLFYTFQHETPCDPVTLFCNPVPVQSLRPLQQKKTSNRYHSGTDFLKSGIPLSIIKQLHFIFFLIDSENYHRKNTQPMHRGTVCQFPFWSIYYHLIDSVYGSNESTGKKTGKTHLCAMVKPPSILPQNLL